MRADVDAAIGEDSPRDGFELALTIFTSLGRVEAADRVRRKLADLDSNT